MKQPTCYKKPTNLTCIDLFLTNAPRSFQSTSAVETGLSDSWYPDSSPTDSSPNDISLNGHFPESCISFQE